MARNSKWPIIFDDLDPDDQLKAAQKIMDELRLNETYFNDDEYDKKASETVSSFFERLIQDGKKIKELKDLANLFESYEELSPRLKRNFIQEVAKLIPKYLDIQEQDNKERKCQQNGHVFGAWEHNKWTEYVNAHIDHQQIDRYPEQHENWRRVCKICGFVQEVDEEPQELINARKAKKRAKRIKKIRAEAKKLGII